MTSDVKRELVSGLVIYAMATLAFFLASGGLLGLQVSYLLPVYGLAVFFLSYAGSAEATAESVLAAVVLYFLAFVTIGTLPSNVLLYTILIYLAPQVSRIIRSQRAAVPAANQ